MEEGQKRKSAKRSEREREGKKGEEKKRRRASRASCHLRRTGGSLAYYATESVSLFPPFLFPSFSFGSIAFSPDGESFVPRCGLFTLNSAESLGYCLASAAEKVQRRFERKRGVEN